MSGCVDKTDSSGEDRLQDLLMEDEEWVLSWKRYL